MRKKFDITQWLAYAILIIICAVWIIPLLFAFTTSFRSTPDVVTNGFRLLPVDWILDNYVAILSNTTSAPIVTWMFNSLFIAVLHTLGVVFICSITAYGYTRMKFKGRDQLFFILLGVSLFPQVVNLIPSYKIIDSLGWVNSSLAMIVPGLAGMGNLFLVRSFMGSIPKELDESARIDGAGEFTIYSRIILPLVKPVLICAGLFAFTGSWNDFIWPVIVYSDVEKMPVTAGLLLLQDMYGNYRVIGQLMGSALIAIIPTLLLFLFAQKYFIQSLNLNAGLKG